MNQIIYHIDEFFLFYMSSKLDEYLRNLFQVCIVGGRMRSIGTFSDELHFPLGIPLSMVFSPDECCILEVYGLTMQGLQEGTLMPASAAEHYFLAEIDGEFAATSNLAKCWLKYSKKVARYELKKMPLRSNKRVSPAINDRYVDSEVLALDIDDDNDTDDKNELDI
ncbi:MAG: hypothetical protein ACI86X_000884 [Moritella sp.]|jgi:uncharacterized protein YifE (UPF0438 family)